MTAQYGEEAGHPKASGRVGDPVYEETKKREKCWKRVQKFEADIKEFQSRFNSILLQMKEKRKRCIGRWKVKVIAGSDITWGFQSAMLEE